MTLLLPGGSGRFAGSPLGRGARRLLTVDLEFEASLDVVAEAGDEPCPRLLESDVESHVIGQCTNCGDRFPGAHLSQRTRN
jgi:hypothetical protein